MKTLISITLILFFQGCLAQYPHLTKDSLKFKTNKPIVMYGIAGIYQPVDSSKIYYHKAIELRKRGVSDSCNKYFILLKN